MEYANFICEVFCFRKSSPESIKYLTEELLNQGQTELNYSHIFKTNTRIRLVVIYAYMFEEFFGVLPSKVFLSELLDKNSTNMTCQEVVNTLTHSNDIMRLFLTNHETRNKFHMKYNSICTHLFKDPANIKTALARLLQFRHTGSKTVQDLSNITLFYFYTKLLTKNYDVHVHDIGLDTCPITKCVVSMERLVDHDCITLRDCLSYTLYKNAYFLRSLFIHGDKTLIVVPSTSFASDLCKHISKSRNKYTLLTQDPIQDNIFNTPFVNHYMQLLPLAQMNRVLFLSQEFIETQLHVKSSYPFFIMAQAMDDFLSGKMSYNKYIYRLYGQCENIKSGYSATPKENVVVLIDNRANALSFMSCVITGANLEPEKWSLVLYTSASARDFYKQAFQMLDIPVCINDSHPRLNCPAGSFDIEDYNFIMKDSVLWSQLHCMGFRNALIIQDDGMLIRPGLEQRFLNQYDYVGAPWHHTDEVKRLTNPYLVGNGGLSLRNVFMHLQITKEDGVSEKRKLFNNNLQPIPEDVYFAGRIQTIGGRIPTTEKASEFSSEMIINNKSLGFHKPWPYNNATSVDEFFNLQEAEKRD